ncbi:MAG: DUF2784 domain-containing protein [Desulfamplus sp.]|nr:DUF2784 domain-containing protein [Desulfamplus sp.]
MESYYTLLADVVLILHFSIALFVVSGLVLIIVGNIFGWGLVNALWFRLVHFSAIATIVAESWLGIVCPLTTLEGWLRSKAGLDTYNTGFIEHWLQKILFYDAPSWVFILGYTLFAVAVGAAWWYFPPANPTIRNKKNLEVHRKHTCTIRHDKEFEDHRKNSLF